MKITITQDHWNKALSLKGTRPPSTNCPIALAISEYLGSKALVGFSMVSIDPPNRYQIFSIDEVGKKLVHDFDNSVYPTLPRTITLREPIEDRKTRKAVPISRQVEEDERQEAPAIS